MYEVDERIRYMMPLDADYSYADIIELRRGRALVRRLTYPEGLEVEVPYRYMQHVRRDGKRGSSTRQNGE